MAKIKEIHPDDPDKGINLALPTKGSTDWAEDFENYFAIAIRDHDHSGSGKGALLNATTLSVGAVANTDTVGATLVPTTTPAQIDDLKFILGIGESMVIEYSLTNASTQHFRGGILSLIHYRRDGEDAEVAISDEYMGDDLNDVIFSVSSTGLLRYINLNGDAQDYRFRYFIRKIVTQ